MNNLVQPSLTEYYPQSSTIPNIVYGNSVDERIIVDPFNAAQAMIDLGISLEKISSTTIYIGGGNNLVRRGMQLSKSHDRAIHGALERNDGEGFVLRVNSILKGKQRSTEAMNQTLIHELEHIAQIERGDYRVKVGNIAIFGLTGVGLIVGSIAGRKLGGIGLTLVLLTGSVAGHELGYLIAPHERQARQRAGQASNSSKRVTTKAISFVNDVSA